MKIETMKPVQYIPDAIAPGGGHRAVEPGLLGVFRIFLLLVAALLVLRIPMATTFNAHFLNMPSPLPGTIAVALLLAYLCSARIQRGLGRFYLPLAIIVFVALALLSGATLMKLRVAAGAPADELARSSWVMIVLLLVPLVLVAWQYGLRWASAYCVVTAVADIALVLPLARFGGLTPAWLLTIALMRTIVLLPVGYAVAGLMNVQRRQRTELAEANARLAHYAATLESIAAERERNRLAHELHDTLAHGLTSLAVQLEAMMALWPAKPDGQDARMVRSHGREGAPDTLRTMLSDALVVTRTALSESRRAITALRARPLEDMGLAPALRQLAESTATHAGLELTLELPTAAEGLGSETEHAIFRIASEAVANVVRHANARRLTMNMTDDGHGVRLTIADDGRGFDTARRVDHGHFGLYGMHERAHMIGAEIVVESAPGKGTRVCLSVRRKSDTRPDM